MFLTDTSGSDLRTKGLSLGEPEKKMGWKGSSFRNIRDILGVPRQNREKEVTHMATKEVAKATAGEVLVLDDDDLKKQKIA